MIPLGPPKKPYNLLDGFACLSASYKPAITLCPPGACPPDRITPTFLCSTDFESEEVLNVTVGFPYVFLNYYLISG